MLRLKSLWLLLFVCACSGPTPQVIVATAPILAVAPAQPSMAVGNSLQLHAIKTVEGTSTPLVAVAWTSSDTSVATVSATGLVRSLAVGTSLITVTAGDLSAVTVVTVQLGSGSSTGASLTVAPDAPTIPLGASRQLLLFRTAGGSMEPVTDATWTSSNPTVASVSSTGLVQSLTTGTTLIVATQGGLSAIATVTVSPIALTSIDLSPDNDSACITSQIKVRAIAKYSDGTILDVTNHAAWMTSDAAIASYAGLYEAATYNAISEGTVTLAATYAGAFGTTSLTVLGLQSSPQITAMQDLSALPVGQSARLQLTGTCADSSSIDLTSKATWGVLAETTSFTVSTGGFVTPRAAGIGTAQAKVGDATYTKAITVVPAVTASVAVSPNRTITAGQNTTVSATATRTDNSTFNVTNTATWTSSNVGIATVDSSGNVHGVAGGVAQVTATVEGKSGSATITVNPPPVTSSVAVSPNRTIIAGEDTTVTATATRTDGSTFSATSIATWTSSNVGIATVDSTGNVHGVAAGVAQVTATVDGKSGSAMITVNPPPVTATVSVSPNRTILVGADTTMTATATRTDSSQFDATSSATWTSANLNVATVSSTGRVHAVAAGTTQVTATIDGKSGSATVTVNPLPVTASVAVGPDRTVAAGKDTTVAATATRTDDSQFNATSTATWTSSNVAVATVDSVGNVHAVAVGIATVSATVDGKTGSATITVTPAVVVKTEIRSLISGVFPVGFSTQAQLVKVYSDGSLVDVSSQAAWTSSNPGNVTVTSGDVIGGSGSWGLITPTREAILDVTVRALYQGTTYSLPSFWPDKATTTLSVTPVDPSLVVGVSRQFIALGTPSWANGGSNLSAHLIWTSSDPSVASVTNDEASPECSVRWGCVKTLSAGSTSICATRDSLTACSTLTVVAP